MVKKKRNLKVVAMDPSMRNWGIAIFDVDPETYELYVTDLKVIHSNKDPKKAKRKSSRDIMTVEELLNGLLPYIEDADVIVAETPIGGRDSAAALSYSICISIIAAINVGIVKVFEVTPNEVKLNVEKNASKSQMISWAVDMHPEAPWKYRTVKGNRVIVSGFAEHVADAIGVLYAAAKKKDFFNLINSFKGKSK